MLNASSTRDLNQAARSAAKYLQELGFELPHARALDLVARLVGKPQHMAAQAALPDAGLGTPLKLTTYGDLARALATLTPEQLKLPVTVSEGCDGNGSADFFEVYEVARADSDILDAGSAGLPNRQLPVLLYRGDYVDPEDRQDDDSAKSVVEDLCKVLINDDVQEALFQVGISDAARSALARATRYVDEPLLLDFPLEALHEAYDDLPVGVDEEAFVNGEGHASLTQDQLTQATRLANALYAAKRNRAAQEQAMSAQDIERLCAQFEMATGAPVEPLRDICRRNLNNYEDVRRIVEDRYEVVLTLGPWLIANDSEQGFWCHGFGWTTSRMAASGFDEAQVASLPVQKLAEQFGSYSRWVRFEDAFDYDRDADPN